jgi:hypothetical protein
LEVPKSILYELGTYPDVHVGILVDALAKEGRRLSSKEALAIIDSCAPQDEDEPQGDEAQGDEAQEVDPDDRPQKLDLRGPPQESVSGDPRDLPRPSAEPDGDFDDAMSAILECAASGKLVVTSHDAHALRRAAGYLEGLAARAETRSLAQRVADRAESRGLR